MKGGSWSRLSGQVQATMKGSAALVVKNPKEKELDDGPFIAILLDRASTLPSLLAPLSVEALLPTNHAISIRRRLRRRQPSPGCDSACGRVTPSSASWRPSRRPPRPAPPARPRPRPRPSRRARVDVVRLDPQSAPGSGRLGANFGFAQR